MTHPDIEPQQPDQQGGSSVDYQAMLNDAQGAPEAQAEINPNELRKQMDNALQRGTTEDLQALFDSGMDINQEDFEGRTALMMTSSQGKKEVVEMLVARGADINRVFNYQDRIPMTALDAARQTGHGEIANILMGLGAKTGKEVAQEQMNSGE